MKLFFFEKRGGQTELSLVWGEGVCEKEREEGRGRGEGGGERGARREERGERRERERERERAVSYTHRKLST